jgi:hypothetical protein
MICTPGVTFPASWEMNARNFAAASTTAAAGRPTAQKQQTDRQEKGHQDQGSFQTWDSKSMKDNHLDVRVGL